MDPSEFFTLTAESELDKKIELSLDITPSGESKPTGELENNTEEHLGWRFVPRDDEIMVYLNRKLKNSSFWYYRIPVLNVYLYHPKDMFDQRMTTPVFFSARGISPIKMQVGQFKLQMRGSGGVQKYEESVLDTNEKEVGLKKALNYREGTHLDSTPTDWLMKEYRDPSSTEENTYVLCKIYNTDKLWPSLNLPPGIPMHEPEKLAKDISLGWRFCPTHEEIMNYLKKKNRDEKYACSYITDVADLYANHPEDLIALNKSERVETWYFFRSTKFSKFGSRTKRGTDKGYWDWGQVKPVLNIDKEHIGVRRPFYYKEGKRPGKNTNWTMHEYHSMSSEQADSWVVCKVYKKEK